MVALLRPPPFPYARSPVRRPLSTPDVADRPSPAPRPDDAGFSIIELLIVVALLGTIAAIVLPLYMDSLDRARVAHAIGDISAIGREAELFWLENDRWPANLGEIDRNGILDPYGNLYVYAVIGSGDGGGGYTGRKDKFLVPVNSDFDLYSRGKDGDSVLPFTAKASHDDIVRAANGAFIGLAEEF